MLLTPHMHEIAKTHNMTSMVSSLNNTLAMNILLKGETELTEEHLADLRLITSSANDTVSADIPKKLEAMAKGIFLTGRKEEFCGVPSDEGQKWLEKNVAQVHSIFQVFIKENEHRCYKEFELASITWGIRPGLVIEMMQGILRYAESLEALTKKNEVNSMSPSELINKLNIKVGCMAKMFLRKIVKRAKTVVQCREQTKSNLVKINHHFRLGFRHLGQMMTRDGYLPSPDLIFNLSLRELQDLLKTKDVHLVKKAMRRNKIIKELDKERYPDLIWGRPVPINSKKELKFESGTEVSPLITSIDNF